MTANEYYQWQAVARFISNPEDYFLISDKISAEMFTGDPLKVFGAFISLIENDKHPDQIRVAEKAGCADDVYMAITNLDYGIDFDGIIEELESGRRERIVHKMMLQLTENKDVDKQTEIIVMALDSINTTTGSSFRSVGTVVDLVEQDIEAAQQGVTTGIKTGFHYFDKMTGGLQKTDLVIIAAEPSQGKTSLALNIAEYSGAKVAIISMEMGEKQLVERMICSVGEIPKQDIKCENPHWESVEKFRRAARQLKEKHIILADIKNSDIFNICGLIRSSVMRYGVDFVIVDYLQLIHAKTQRNREQEMGYIARTLKNLAKELDIPVVVLSQLNRATESYPTLRRLRDSGQIEEAADIVWFIYRPEEYRLETFNGEDTKDLALQIIAKGRNYGTAVFKTDFRKHITKFFNRSEHGSEFAANGGFEERVSKLPF